MQQSGRSQLGKNFVEDDEYNLLMTSMRVSVSKHLLDDHFTVVWANDFYYDLIGYPKEEYEAVFHNQCDLFSAAIQMIGRGLWRLPWGR